MILQIYNFEPNGRFCRLENEFLPYEVDIRPEMVQAYEKSKGEIRKGRRLISPPVQYRTETKKQAAAYYKHKLATKLCETLERIPLD